MKNNIKLITGLLCVSALGLLLAGCGDDKPVEKRRIAPLPVEVVKVERGAITEYISATGRVEPFVRVQLATKLQGRVLECNCEEGQTVKKGQVLIKIDAGDVMAKKAQGEAALAEAAALLKKLDASEREGQAMLTNAESQLKRVEELRKGNVATAEAYDNAVATADAARAKVDGVRAQRDVVKANMSMAKALVQEAEALLAYATITAPIDGVVITKTIEVGDMSTPGVAMLTVEDLSRVKVALVIPEENIRYIKSGTKAKAEFDALPGEVFDAEVNTVIPSGNELSHSFTVKMIMENPELELKPGMFARAGIIKEHRDNTLKLSLDALLEQGEQLYVFKVLEDKVEQVNITGGLRDLANMEVLEGLAEGDLIVTRGKENLTNQSVVRVRL